MKVLLWWPGTSIATADVAAGLTYGFEHHGVTVIPYATHVHIEASAGYLRKLWACAGRPPVKPSDADILYHASVGILERALRLQPDWVVLVSGMYQHPDAVIMLKRAAVRLALVCTESPYDLAGEMSCARWADHVFTNERTCLAPLRTVCPSVSYLRHAWHPDVHRVVEEDRDRTVHSHDVVFVGTGFAERVALLEGVNWDGIDLGLYGVWSMVRKRSPLYRCIRGEEQPNARTAALYRQARIGLNLHRTAQRYARKTLHVARAESLNPRAYELAACGLFHISDARGEVNEVFGGAVPTARTSAELEAQLRTWLAAAPADRAARAAAMRTAVARDHWGVRGGEVVETLRTRQARMATAA